MNGPSDDEIAQMMANHASDKVVSMEKRVALLEAQVKALMDIASHALHISSGDENLDYNWPKAEK